MHIPVSLSELGNHYQTVLPLANQANVVANINRLPSLSGLDQCTKEHNIQK